MSTIHEKKAAVAKRLTEAKAARDRLKSSKPSMLNATEKMGDAITVMDCLIEAVDNLQHVEKG